MEANLNRNTLHIGASTDGIAVVKAVTELPGGAVIDFSRLDSSAERVMAGHLLARDAQTGNVVALKVEDGAYESLPSGMSYLGVLKYAVPRQDPRGGVVTSGQVNTAACPAPVPAGAKSALTAFVWL